MADLLSPKSIQSCINNRDVFQAIVENATIGIMVVIDGVPVYVNNKIIDYTSCTRDELLRQPVSSFLHPKDKERILRDYLSPCPPAVPAPTTLRIIKDPGTTRWIDLNVIPVYWNDSDAILCFLHDVTQHKEYEQELNTYRNNLEEIVRQRTDELQAANDQLSVELHRRKAYESADRENSENYRVILNDIQEIFFEVNLTGHLTFFNNALYDLSGYAPEDLIGAHYSRFTSDTTSDSLFSVFNRIFTTGTPEKIHDYEMACMDGSSRFLAISVSLVRDNSGTPVGFRGIASDITEQKHAEIEMERSRSELEARVQERTAELIQTNMELVKAKEAADKSARAKTEFLANMSHEIRTPLNAIIGMADLMACTNAADKQKEYLSIVRSSSVSLLELVNDILDYSKIDAGKLDIEHVQFSLQEAVDEIADMFLEKNISKELELIVDINDTIPDDLYGDPFRLRQVLSNLVSNAFKFTDNGEICISVKPNRSTTDTLELLFEIKDTGIGIDPALWQNNGNTLFEAFAQADGSTTRKYGGTGLGLAICKKIVTMMGGTIWVTSTPGRGSTFYFTAEFKVKSHTAASPHTLPPHIRNKKVLIVEDNPSTLMVMKRYMESFGFQTELVESAEQALEAVERPGPSGPFSLILMDIRLPGIDGVTTADTIKKKLGTEAPPIIMISALGHENEINRARKAGVDGFLMKPIKQSLLFDTIMEIYGFQSPDNVLQHHGPNPDIFRESRILLVEDNPINQMVVLEMLNHPSIIIDIANTGVEAVDQVRKATYDVVLMDVQMPEMDGIEATKIIRGQMKLSDLPIIAMTAHAMYGDREKCLAAGMNDYISKPIDRHHLFATLTKYIHRISGEDGFQKTEPTAHVPQSFTALPGLNIHEGVNRFGGSWDRYREILQSFYTSFASHTEKIASLIRNGRIHEAIISAHSLKGTAGNISAPDLFNEAGALEEALRNPQDTVKINKLIRSVADRLTIVLTSIKKISDHTPAPENRRCTAPACKPPTGTTDCDELQKQIRCLGNALETSDPVTSASLTESLRQLLWGSKETLALTSLIDRLEAYISDYDFDSASHCFPELESAVQSVCGAGRYETVVTTIAEEET